MNDFETNLFFTAVDLKLQVRNHFYVYVLLLVHLLTFLK